MSNELKRGLTVPEIGTEFCGADATCIVAPADRKRFPTRTKRDQIASIFDPEDWVDEYSDGRQFLDPEPEDWGWRNGK
ncbi:MAG: hypothetical protein ACE14T_06120 [Syntrophales bacterium]